jgi:hypothetical protein
MISETYRAQVDLLLQVLPHVAKEESFALKGGTAINLFVRDMPRLSVDIDLTWLPFDDRATALVGITDALRRVKARVEPAIPACRVALVPQSDGQEAKLTCQTQNAQIKVEVSACCQPRRGRTVSERRGQRCFSPAPRNGQGPVGVRNPRPIC